MRVTGAYSRAVTMMLRENQVTLFDLAGTETTLDFERHVEAYATEFENELRTTYASTVLQLTLDLWASWEVQILRSSYGRAHFGAVHAEERWLLRLDGGPPCALLSNVEVAGGDEQSGICPVSYDWHAEDLLGPICCRAFELEGVGRCYRFYLGRNEV